GLSRMLNRPLSNDDLHDAVSFYAPVGIALACLLLFSFILTLGFSPRTAILCTGFYGLGTITWLYSYLFLTEPLATAATVGAVYSAYLYKIKNRYRWLYISGFLSGLAANSREISGVMALPILTYVLLVGWQNAKDAALKSKLTGGLIQTGIFLLGFLP